MPGGRIISHFPRNRNDLKIAPDRRKRPLDGAASRKVPPKIMIHDIFEENPFQNAGILKQ